MMFHAVERSSIERCFKRSRRNDHCAASRRQTKDEIKGSVWRNEEETVGWHRTYWKIKGKMIVLINVLDRVYESMDKGDMAVGVYLDIEKAFDCINHNILLNKLQYYGIRGVAWNWVSSYLENRKQFVSVNNYNSSVMVINYGVPQGSVLGPLLFLLYINDIQYADSAAILNLFADDTSLFVFDKDPIELFNRCNHALSECYK